MESQRSVFPEALLLAGRPCLVLGGGKVATRKIKLLLEADAIVPAPAPTATPVTLYPLSRLKERLPGADVMITALRTDQPVVSAADLQAAGDGPLTVIDLGVPRNVDPASQATLPPRIRLLDLDDLKRWSRRQSTDVYKLQAQCRKLVLEHKAYYDKLVASFQGRDPR